MGRQEGTEGSETQVQEWTLTHPVTLSAALLLSGLLFFLHIQGLGSLVRRRKLPPQEGKGRAQL